MFGLQFQASKHQFDREGALVLNLKRMLLVMLDVTFSQTHIKLILTIAVSICKPEFSLFLKGMKILDIFFNIKEEKLTWHIIEKSLVLKAKAILGRESLYYKWGVSVSQVTALWFDPNSIQYQLGFIS